MVAAKARAASPSTRRSSASPDRQGAGARGASASMRGRTLARRPRASIRPCRILSSAINRAVFFPPCPRGGITLPRSPSRWNIHGASLPAPILRVRAYPPPIDAGILTSGLPLLVAVGPVRQDPACCAVYLDCNVRSTPSGSTADVPQTAESSNRGTPFGLSQPRVHKLSLLLDLPLAIATLRYPTP